jgi:hypothetical protein
LDFVAGPAAAFKRLNKLFGFALAEADLGLRLPEPGRGLRRLVVDYPARHLLATQLIFDLNSPLTKSWRHDSL